MAIDAPAHLEDELAIRALTARYNHAFDDGRPDEWAATFVEGGTFETSISERTVGRAALADYARTVNDMFATRHLTTEALVEVDGDRATQRCYLLLIDTGATVEGGRPAIITTGAYTDELQRTADGWRFTSRYLTVDGAPA